MLGHHSSDEEFDLKSKHHCTDCPCCIVFIIHLFMFGSLYGWASKNGELGKLAHGMDHNGQVCGVTPAVVNEPYLYWCQKKPDASAVASGKLSVDVDNAVCVSSCPGTSGSTSCSSGSFSYATFTFHNYCLPDPNQYPGVSKKVANSQLANVATEAMQSASVLPKAWPVLVASFVAAMVFGFIFLFLLKHCAEPLVWISMLLTIIGLGWLGIYLWQWSENPKAFEGQPESTSKDDIMATRAIAVACWVIAFLMMCLACCFRHSIETASAVIECTCEVIFEMPSLLAAPAIKAMFKGLVATVLLYGFLLVLSTCDQTPDAEGQVSLTPADRERLIGYMFSSFWILAFFNALYQFSIAYAVVDWYYAPYEDGEKRVSHCAVFEGFFTGTVYHTGSLALGSFLIACFMTLQKLIEYAQHKNEEGGDNEIIKCVLCCCMCCIHCCKDTIEFLNKNAYIDMAITSDGFCGSAKNAIETVSSIGGAMAILTGATHVFLVFGVASITIASGFFSFLLCRAGTFSDSTSEYYVADPKPVMIVSMIIGCVVALAFMNVFDMAADTLLFCYGYDLQSGHGAPTAPDALKDLVHGNQSNSNGKANGRRK